MNDFDGLLASDFGLKPQGRAAPMSASKGSSNFTSRSTPNDDVRSKPNHNSDAFADLFGASSAKPEPRDAPFNLDAMFRGSTDFGSKSVNLPVYDKPVYDDDIFDGIPGLKSSSKVTYDDVFASMDSTKGGGGGGGGGGAFDDLLGGFGKAKSSRSEKDEKGVADFDDLIPGFGSSKNTSDRQLNEAQRTLEEVELEEAPSS